MWELTPAFGSQLTLFGSTQCQDPGKRFSSSHEWASLRSRHEPVVLVDGRGLSDQVPHLAGEREPLLLAEVGTKQVAAGRRALDAEHLAGERVDAALETGRSREVHEHALSCFGEATTDGQAADNWTRRPLWLTWLALCLALFGNDEQVDVLLVVGGLAA